MLAVVATAATVAVSLVVMLYMYDSGIGVGGVQRRDAILEL